jgi:hypothetical protein
MLDEPELGGRDAGTADTLGRDVSVLDRQASQGVAKGRHRQAKIDERAEDHVARCAGKAVEIQSRQLETALFLEAVIANVGEDDVVDHIDPHQHTRRRQSPRQLHVVRTWSRIA